LLSLPEPEYHGINGNVSLDRRSEFVQSPNRYDLSLKSDKSSTLSREQGTYDLGTAEHRAKNEQENLVNNNNVSLTTNTTTTNGTNGTSNNGTLDSRDGEAKKKKWPTDKSYFLAKEILMTERTYKKDLDVINAVSSWKIYYRIMERE
jgi:FERM, RhoGEF and pleckstrin domain protein 2